MYIATLLLAVAIFAAVGAAILGVVFEFDEPELGLGAVTGILLHAYGLYALSCLGILYNSFASALLVLLLLIGGCIAIGGHRWWLRALGRLRAPQLVGCACLVGLYLAFCFVRARNPQIWGEEKFMDFTFLNGIWRSEHFPPNDPWFAGGTINYYYFGYLMVADLARLTGIPTAYMYNLALALWFGLSFASAYATGHLMTGRVRYALLAGVMLVICGNLDGAFQALNGHVGDFSYWKSSRIVDPDNTINEFPFFSFIHADLHPHVMSIPLLLLLLHLLLRFVLRPGLVLASPAAGARKLGRYALLAVLLGALPCTNVADVPTFWGLTILTFALLTLRFRSDDATPLVSPRLVGRLPALVVAVVLPLAVGYLLYWPFHAKFQSAQVQGLGLVTRRTVWHEFLVVHGLFFFVLVSELLTRPGPLDPRRPWARREPAVFGLTALGVVVALSLDSLIVGLMLVMLVAMALSWIRRAADVPPVEDYANLLTLTILGLLVGCEIVFVRDFYGGSLERLNTVFKFYYQAWILLALVTPWALQRFRLRFAEAGSLRLWNTAFLLLLVGSLVYPVLGMRARYFRDPPAGTLYGMDHIVKYHAAEHDAMLWLQQNAPRDARLLELPGPPYQYAGRFSANTGIPTLLGWVQHEAFWRDNTYAIPRKREQEARSIYESPRFTDEVRRLLNDYGVKYIVVGEVERAEVPADGLAKFGQLPVVFPATGTPGDVTIYEWRR